MFFGVRREHEGINPSFITSYTPIVMMVPQGKLRFFLNVSFASFMLHTYFVANWFAPYLFQRGVFQKIEAKTLDHPQSKKPKLKVSILSLV